MTTYNTGNPIGSANVKDLYDNAENLDTAVNGTEQTWTDRLGRERLTLDGAIVLQATGEVNVYFASTKAAGDALAASLPDLATVIVDADESLDGVRVRYTVASGALTDPVVDTAAGIQFTQAGTGAVARTLQSKLQESISPQDFGALGGGADDADAYRKAIVYASATGKKIVVNGLDSTFGSQVEMLSNVTIEATNSSITVNGTTVKVPFKSDLHCQTDYFAFAQNMHIKGMKFICSSELPSGAQFVTYTAWKAINVRNWSMEECEFYNMGGAYITHAVRNWGTYNADLAASTNPAIDPAVTAGLSATGGDLSEDIRFNKNRCFVPVRTTDGIKTLLQMFRHEFCERVNIRENDSVRGAISGWGGDAIINHGGALIHYRRCRDVVAHGNRLLEPNALYWINGYNVIATSNRVYRGIDLGIDFEGCVDCQAVANFIYSTGNGSLGTFYHAKNVRFTGNTCVEDGTSKNINAEFGITQWSPSNSETLILNSGAHSPLLGDDDTKFSGNTFIWANNTGSGFSDIRDASLVALNDNEFFNVAVRTQFNNTGRVIFKDNDLSFTQDALRTALMAFGDNKSGTFAPDVTGNTVYLTAAQTSPCYVMHFFQDANDNMYTEVMGNRFYHHGNVRFATADIALQNTSVNAGRIHTYRLGKNVFGPGTALVDLSTRGAAHVLRIDDDNTVFTGANATDVDYTDERTGVSAFFASTLPTGYAFLSGQRFMNQDNRATTSAGIMATANGWDLPTTAAWAATTPYSVGQVSYTTAGNVYFCSVAGTSGSTAPTGNTPTDGTVQWTRVGNRLIWKQLAALGSEVQRT